MRISTGIEGLDYLLHGGLLPGRVYLVEGGTGTGKTTLGLHFLSAGGSGLLITLNQSAEGLGSDARSLGLDVDRVRILDLTPPGVVFKEARTYDIFLPAEVEQDSVTQLIARTIEDVRPERIFVDGFGQLRHLAADLYQYRRLVQSFFRFATDRGATLMVVCEDQQCERDVDGIIELSFSHAGRSVRLRKFRGSDFHAGCHPMRLTGTGLEIFPGAA
jgi:circadian clock protein KaiC